jgi:hypothetical protein
VDVDAPVALPYRLAYRGIIYGETRSELQTALDALKALRGVTAALVREVGVDDPFYELAPEQWCWARLLQTQSTREVKNGLWLEVQIDFEITSSWRGVHRSDDYALTAAVSTLLVPNLGSAPVSEIILTLTAHADITQVDITASAEIALRYTDTIRAGTALVLDTGILSIQNAGADAYDAHFQLLDTHTLDEWLLLRSPATILTVTLGGGDGQDVLHLDYYDAWE